MTRLESQESVTCYNTENNDHDIYKSLTNFPSPQVTVTAVASLTNDELKQLGVSRLGDQVIIRHKCRRLHVAPDLQSRPTGKCHISVRGNSTLIIDLNV